MADSPCASSIDAKTLSSLDDRAHSINDEFEDIGRRANDLSHDGLPETKRVARAFIAEALLKPLDQQHCLLKLTEGIGDSRREITPNLPQLIINFSAKDQTLARVQLSYPTSPPSLINEATREVIDLYAP